MRLNSKVTGGLAWAGLILVLAVPSADMLTKPSANSATVTSDMTETASIAPAAKPGVPAAKAVTPMAERAALAATPVGEDAVDKYIASGRKLPSYISDAPVATEQALAPVATEPLVVPGRSGAATAEAEEAAAGDRVMNLAMVAPQPYPASMRPKLTVTSALPADEEPLILDDAAVARREATLRAVEPVLDDEPRIIDGEELQEWDSGSLAEYLERKGLISDAGDAEPVDSDYDADGFYLSDGPNSQPDRSGARLIRRLDGGFFLF